MKTSSSATWPSKDLSILARVCVMFSMFRSSPEGNQVLYSCIAFRAARRAFVSLGMSESYLNSQYVSRLHFILLLTACLRSSSHTARSGEHSPA